MKTLGIKRNIIVSIFAVMLLMYGVQGISYAQGDPPTVEAGEINTTLKVSFRDWFDEGDVRSYQIQFRRKDPQGDWITECDVFTERGGAGASWLNAIPGIGSTLADHFGFGGGGGGGSYVTVYFSFTDLEPGTTYEARYRYTGLSECSHNPPNPDPWSAIAEGTTHLVTPPRVDFVDATLAEAVRDALDLDTVGGHIELLKIPEAALAKLTELDYSRKEVSDRYLSFRRKKIANLTGLEHASQLTKLYLGGNEITDIALLARLTQLTTLELGNSEISRPIIDIGELNDPGANQISDISPLARLTQLTTLDLGGNQISDISPLARLTQLTTLDLGGNQISDISPLAQLSQLTTLDLEGNQILDIASLASLALTALDLKGNQIQNITPLAQWTHWEHLTELKLSYNQISDITLLAQLAKSSVTELDLRDNQINDVTPLAKLIHLETLYLWDNPIEDTSPLSTLLDENPDLWIDIRIVTEEGGATITASTLQPLTGITLDGAIVKLTLSSGAFHYDRTIIRPALTISGIPGIGIAKWSEIEILDNLNPKEIEIKLTFNGNNIATDTILTLTVGPRAIENYNGPAYTLEIPVTAVSETELAELSKALVASTDNPLTATTLDGAVVTLRLTSGVYHRRYYDELKVSGIQGVTFGVEEGDDYWGWYWDENGVNWVSDTEITFELAFSGTLDADATLTFTLEPEAIAAYSGPARTAELSVSASTEREVTGELVASPVFPLSAKTLHGSVVKLTLKTKSFKGNFANDYAHLVTTYGIPDVNVGHWGWGSNINIFNKKEAYVLLSFNGNLTTDTTLILSVPSRLIENYKGPTDFSRVTCHCQKGKAGAYIGTLAFDLHGHQQNPTFPERVSCSIRVISSKNRFGSQYRGRQGLLV